jgi:putative oxidoreductase
MLSILRIVAAFVFVWHGTQKIFGYPPSTPPQEYVLMTQRGLAGILETFGGGLLLLGLFTRPVAFLLAGEMAVAYFQVHNKRGFIPLVNGGDNAVLFCFIFLYLMLAGGGPWSIDHAIATRGGKAST